MTDGHLRAIGLVASRWSWVELHLEQLIWELGDFVDKRGPSITTHIPSATRVHILKTLAESELSVAHSQKLNSILGRMDGLRIERNNIVHALWMPPNSAIVGFLSPQKPETDELTLEYVKVNARGKLSIQPEKFTLEAISKVADKIEELVWDMRTFLEGVMEHRQALKKAPPKP